MRPGKSGGQPGRSDGCRGPIQGKLDGTGKAVGPKGQKRTTSTENKTNRETARGAPHCTDPPAPLRCTDHWGVPPARGEPVPGRQTTSLPPSVGAAPSPQQQIPAPWPLSNPTPPPQHPRAPRMSPPGGSLLQARTHACTSARSWRRPCPSSACRGEGNWHAAHAPTRDGTPGPHSSSPSSLLRGRHGPRQHRWPRALAGVQSAASKSRQKATAGGRTNNGKVNCNSRDTKETLASHHPRQAGPAHTLVSRGGGQVGAERGDRATPQGK